MNERYDKKLVEAVRWAFLHGPVDDTTRCAELAIAAIDASGTHRVERVELRQAAAEFVAKVDRGEARSVRSYAAFKTALAERQKAHTSNPGWSLMWDAT